MKTIGCCSLLLAIMILLYPGSVGAFHPGDGKEVDGAQSQPTGKADGPFPKASTPHGNREAVPAGLSKTEWGEITASVERDRYRLQKDENTGWYQAPNEAHGLDTTFTREGFTVSPQEEEKGWIWGLSLNRYGYGSDLHAVPVVEKVMTTDNRIEYHRGDLVEWYINDHRGLEQGFTLEARPSGRPDTGLLQLQMTSTTNLVPGVEDDGRGTVFRNAHGEEILRYSGLFAYDATGQKLSASMAADQEGIRLSVADRGAVYPITIDPFVERKKLLADDGAASDWFGRSVSISGDTAIVGAGFDDDGGSESGSAYIFFRDQGGADNWGQVQKLTASDAAAFDHFGESVSISGNTAIVGALFEDGSGIDRGAVYVFSRDQGGVENWGQVRKLVASDAADGDLFGNSVSISGGTVIVGAHGDSDDGAFSGSAYIFSRDLGGPDNWGEVKKLTASDREAGDSFGSSVSISNQTSIVGAYLEDENGSGSGSAYIFSRDQGGSDNWGEVKKLIASDGASEDNFGWSVSISGDTAVVGAYLDDNTWPNAGSAYFFSRAQGGAENWGEVNKFAASDAASGDLFGYSVSIGGDAAVVGAAYDDDNGSDAGSAYISTDLGIFSDGFESGNTLMWSSTHQ